MSAAEHNAVFNACEYEYGIMGRDTDPHRVGMSEEEARMWLAEWVEMGGSAELFTMARRCIGAWESV